MPSSLILRSGGSATAVSKGAVLRAFNKEDGPSRKLQSNFGLKRKEIFDPKLDGHLKASAPKREKDNLDGEIYVRDIIEWKLFKVSLNSLSYLGMTADLGCYRAMI